MTLVGCLQISQEARTRPLQGDRTYSATIFPHFIAEGRVHLPQGEPSIRAVHFTFEDADSLFHDFDAFGSLLDASPFIEAIVAAQAKQYGRPIHIGPTPEIAYFTGRYLIVEVDTVLGKIRAEHCPTTPMGGPRGVRIDNQISICIIPNQPTTFGEAVERIYPMLRFITIAVGRAQNLPMFSIDVGSAEASQRLDVYWSNHPKRWSRDSLRRKPDSGDLPLDPVNRPEEFVAVLGSWTKADSERRSARVRLNDSFIRQSFYPIDRLVGAANAFDLLPKSAVPDEVQLTAAVGDAKERCRTIFRSLPRSDERQTILGALGRLGQATLKQKIRHRAKIITRATGDQYFQSLDFACDRAVDCRNFYVHGAPVKFDLESPSPHFSFLTDTLEFVFAASELIEAGWSILPFLKRGTSMTHPFGAYAVNYGTRLQALRNSMKRSVADQD